MGVDCTKRSLNDTVPSVAVSRPNSTLASVDFPQPDSPTMATVSAWLATKLMSSTALTERCSPPPNSGLAATL